MSVQADPRIGSELAGYRIDALLGRGGMGVVYRAHDLALDRDVALKLLSPAVAADASFRERFLRESRLEPSNVLVAADEHVYLADFGLSRSLGEAGSSLGATQSLGTSTMSLPSRSVARMSTAEPTYTHSVACCRSV